MHNVNNKMQILAKRYIFEYEFSGEINNKGEPWPKCVSPNLVMQLSAHQDRILQLLKGPKPLWEYLIISLV